MSDTLEEERIPLEEWCREKSATDKRVELLAVFAFRERQAGRNHDVPTAYASRYEQTESVRT